jgi:hypothetical protein
LACAGAAVIPVLLRVQRLFDLTVDKIAFFDRRRRIRRCSAYDGKVSYPSVQRALSANYSEAERVWKRGVAGPQACPAEERAADPFRAGIVPMEAFALQLSELRALPTIEPKRRLG